MNDDISKLISELETRTNEQHQQKLANIENSRNIYHDNMANQANASGMLFSNFAPTKNLQYDAQKYYPAVAQQMNVHLTTRDKQLEQGRKLKAQFDKLNEGIRELNSDLGSGGSAPGGVARPAVPQINPQAMTNANGKASYDALKQAVGNKWVSYGTDEKGNHYIYNQQTVNDGDTGKMVFYGNDKAKFDSELAKYKNAGFGMMNEVKR